MADLWVFASCSLVEICQKTAIFMSVTDVTSNINNFKSTNFTILYSEVDGTEYNTLKKINIMVPRQHF
jgi:hypothetical protein